MVAGKMPDFVLLSSTMNNSQRGKQIHSPITPHAPAIIVPDSTVDLPEPATIDLDRRRRCGFGEVIYGEGKSMSLIEQIAIKQLAAGNTVLATRVDPAIGEALQSHFTHARFDPLARTLRIDPQPFDPENFDAQVDPHVAVITAGSTDAPVSAEATQTLCWMRIPHRRYDDIGVAGPQRLQARIDEIRTAAVIVVIAGMEGALPSVVAGHVSAPLIAVPTSVGYGANLGGITPLLSAMASCAAGVMTVGIDAGFKGGYCAGLIVRSIANAGASARANATGSNS